MSPTATKKTPDPAEAARRAARELLAGADIRPTPNRLAVLAAVLAAPGAVTAPELEAGLAGSMNRVTLYRILDLLAGRGVLLRTQGAERAFQYCRGHGHGHFHCRRCGRTQCVVLPLAGGVLDPAGLARNLTSDLTSNLTSNLAPNPTLDRPGHSDHDGDGGPDADSSDAGPGLAGVRIEAVDIRLDGICRQCLREDAAREARASRATPFDPEASK